MFNLLKIMWHEFKAAFHWFARALFSRTDRFASYINSFNCFVVGFSIDCGHFNGFPLV